MRPVTKVSIKSTGELLADGGIIEIVKQAGDDPGLTLLHWNDEQARISSRLELSGKVYECADVPPSFLRAVRFPFEIGPCKSAPVLVEELSMIIAKFSGLSDVHSRVAAFFLIASWCFDGVGIAPRLCVIGPQSRGAAQLMRLLACLCRHALILADIAPAALLSLPFEFGLTLVFNQCRLTEGLRQFLDASSNANQFVVQGGRFVNPFCSVALHTERVIGESAAFASIKLPLWPIRTEIAFLDFSTEEEIGKEFQAKLLTFRLSNVQVARKCNFDPSELSSPSRETARSLGACYSGDPDLQREIVSLLRDADAQARVRSSTCQEAVVVEAMLFLCHEKNGDKGGNLRVSEIADAVRVINIGREEITSPSPRGVGEILRALGFETTKLDKKGRGIILCRDIDRRVHEVAFNFGVPSLWKGMPNCVGCKSVWEGSDGRGGEQ